MLLDIFALFKPRVMSLVVFTGFAGMIAAPGTPDVLLMITGIACISLCAGAAGALNMWYESDIDRVMSRTWHRPLPQGRIAPNRALGLGIGLTVAPIVVMGVIVNWLAAALLGLASLIYVVAYTMWLKRLSPQNIVIGGASGALPPLIGWVCMTGEINIPGFLLFLIIFLWTPPHFWALALLCRQDYERAGIPMMPVIAGEDKTRLYILFYTVLLWPAAIAPVFFGVGGILYAASSAILGAAFIAYSLYLYLSQSRKASQAVFSFSILYLFLLFSTLIGNEFL